MPHDHAHPHAHTHTHGPGHNHAGPDHLHSHIHDHDRAKELQVLSAQFIDGFIQARDKSSYLRLAGVPFERDGKDGKDCLKLVDVQLCTEWQVGTASPGFGTQQLSYLPFPGEMVLERTNMAFIYVSIREKEVLDLREFLVMEHTISS